VRIASEEKERINKTWIFKWVLVVKDEWMRTPLEIA
jgi:hypothetical protein